jgi:hypothetical protein
MYEDRSNEIEESFHELRMGNISERNIFLQKNPLKENDSQVNRTYDTWSKDVGTNWKNSLDYILSRLDNYQLRVAIVGSSTEEKYPVGRDLDVCLIGYGEKDALKFANSLYEKFEKEIQKNLNSILKKRKVNFPTSLYIRRVEDPFLAGIRKTEIISGHGGTNFELKVIPEKKDTYRKIVEKVHFSNLIDIIVDVSYRNKGIKENFEDWKLKMEKNNKNYLIIN